MIPLNKILRAVTDYKKKKKKQQKNTQQEEDKRISPKLENLTTKLLAVNGNGLWYKSFVRHYRLAMPQSSKWTSDTTTLNSTITFQIAFFEVIGLSVT